MPDEIRQVGFDALLLALGYGLVVPHTATLARDEAGDLLIRGRLAGPVATALDPRLRAHVTYVSSVSGVDRDGLRDWLRWQGKGLDLTAQRLRDTWLVSRTQVATAVTPLVVLMDGQGLGRVRLLLAGSQPLAADGSSLRCLRDV